MAKKTFKCEFHGANCQEYGHENEIGNKHCSHCGAVATPENSMLIDLVDGGVDTGLFWLLCAPCLKKLESKCAEVTHYID